MGKCPLTNIHISNRYVTKQILCSLVISCNQPDQICKSARYQERCMYDLDT